jgi:hypothetical protein
MAAMSYTQNQPSQLNELQEGFARDILSCFQMLNQMSEWEKSYKQGGSSGAVENSPANLTPADTNKTPKQ